MKRIVALLVVVVAWGSVSCVAGEREAAERGPRPRWREAAEPERPSAGDTREAQRTLRSGDRQRSYIVHVPSGYDGKTPRPLVLALHGRHGTGAGQPKLTGLDGVSDREGFLVVYPDGVDKSWNAGHGAGGAEKLGVDDVAFAGALIDAVVAEFAVDRKRVFAVGMSNGGAMVHRLGCEMGDRLAGIASIAGTMSPTVARRCESGPPVSAILFHGTADRLVPYDGGTTRGGGELLSVQRTAEVWRKRDRCEGSAEVSYRKGEVVCRTHAGCAGGSAVTVCTIDGGGHTWPGGWQYAPKLLVGPTTEDINASNALWEFFASRSR